MSQKPFWKRPLTYVIVFGLLLVITGALVGPDLTKMDWTKVGSRASWQLPDRVITTLELEPGDAVADIGAGDGYFTFRLAEAVGPNGKVFAVEVDDDLVDILRRRATEEKYSSVLAIMGQRDDPLLPDKELDLVFLCNAYHHIKNRPEYFARLRRDLRPGGRVAIIDMKAIPLVRLTTPAGHWTAVEAMQEEMRKANYRSIASFDFLPAQNFVVFSPVPAANDSTETSSRLPPDE